MNTSVTDGGADHQTLPAHITQSNCPMTQVSIPPGASRSVCTPGLYGDGQTASHSARHSGIVVSLPSLPLSTHHVLISPRHESKSSIQHQASGLSARCTAMYDDVLPPSTSLSRSLLAAPPTHSATITNLWWSDMRKAWWSLRLRCCIKTFEKFVNDLARWTSLKYGIEVLPTAPSSPSQLCLLLLIFEW